MTRPRVHGPVALLTVFSCVLAAGAATAAEPAQAPAQPAAAAQAQARYVVRDAQTGQFIDSGRGPLGIGRGVSHQQLDQSSIDATRLIDAGDGEFESGKQMPTGLDPARWRQRRQSTNPDRRRHASASPGRSSGALCRDRAHGRQ